MRRKIILLCGSSFLAAVVYVAVMAVQSQALSADAGGEFSRKAAHTEAATAHISAATTGSPAVSAAGKLSSADAGKDILVYAASSPSSPGYRPNIFSGCIHSVAAPNRLQLGVWRGGACVPAPYPGASVSGAYPIVIYGHDDTAALQAAVNGLGPGKELFVGRTVFIHDTIVFANKTGGEFHGISMNGQVRQSPFAGSSIVWAGPAGKPMLRFVNSGGMYIHDLHLTGNSNRQNRPGALIDIAPPARALAPNRFQGISNMYGSTLDSVFNTADNGIYIEPGTQRIADKFSNIRLFSVEFACFNNQNSGASGPDFSDITCQQAPVAVYCVNGGRVEMGGATELLTVGQVFHLGGGCSVSALHVEAENDTPGQEGITQLAYFERGKGSQGGGALRIGRCGYGPTSKLPTPARPSFLGHRLTPNAIIDTDTSAPIVVELDTLYSVFTANPRYAYRRAAPWLINLPAVDGPSAHTFRCRLCLGLTARNIDLSPGGYAQSRNVLELVNMPGYGAPFLFLNRVMSGAGY